MKIQVDQLCFSYKSVEVLRGVSFEAPAGSLVAVLGENGSGKTTLLKTINRLLIPQSGAVFIAGESMAGLSASEIAKRFGYMSQQQETVQSNVFETVLLGIKAADGGMVTARHIAAVEEILRLVRMEDLAMRHVHTLSGGELQKVILARALAQKPRVLLLDEPINHLDMANQVEIMNALRAITRELNIISLIVTHNLNNALQFADRFILLKDGVVQAAGGPEIITPATIQEVFRITVVLEHIAGVPVVVPDLRGAMHN